MKIASGALIGLAALLTTLSICVQHAKAEQFKESALAKKDNNKSNFWKIVPWPDDINVQFPGTGLRRRVNKSIELPDQSVVHVNSKQKNLQLIHSGGLKSTISGPGIYHLNENYLWKTSAQQRTALDILPSNLIQEEQKKDSRIENLLGFFVPRVPFAQEIPARIMGPDEKTTQPIRPLFPPPVHFIETATLPVQIGLEWIVENGQVDPHSVYLWSESHFVNAPNAVVRGGRGVISLSKYGRYYWQIEDATQQFLSVPRTIIVIRPGGQVDDEIAEEKMQKKNQAKPEKEESLFGGMQLTLPKHRSHFFACNISTKKQVNIPVQLHVQRGEFKALELSVLPEQFVESQNIPINDSSAKITTYLKFKRPGSFELRAHLYSNKLNQKIPLSLVELQISDICDELSGQFTFGQIESLFEDGRSLSNQGSLNFLPLSREVQK
jgi:hypothetical protein